MKLIVQVDDDDPQSFQLGEGFSFTDAMEEVWKPMPENEVFTHSYRFWYEAPIPEETIQ